jgi:hypothetical protein
MTNRARPIPFTFTPQAQKELGIVLSPLHQRLDELVELETKREAALHKWLASKTGSQESGDAAAVLDSLNNQVSGLASVIAFLWRQS